MGQIETIISISRRIESVLEDKYGASGKGLHSKVSSVQDLLPRSEIKNIRYIATIRNNAVHEANFKVKDIKAFTQKAQRTLAVLDTHANRNKGSIQKIQKAKLSQGNHQSGVLQNVVEQAAQVDKSKAKLSLMRYSDAELIEAKRNIRFKKIAFMLLILGCVLIGLVTLKGFLPQKTPTSLELPRLLPKDSPSQPYDTDIDDLLE